MKYPILFLAGCLVWPATAFATNANVSTPHVTKGVSTLEFRAGVEYDEDAVDRYQQRLHLDYGVNDWLALRAVTKQEQQEGNHLEYRATDAEIRVQLFDSKKDGFVGGFKVAYSFADGDDGADSLKATWLYEIERHGFTYRNNLAVGTELGEDSDSSPNLEASWQVLANIWEDHSLGLELFNQFGAVNDWEGYDAQGHRLGPVLRGRFAKDVTYQTGILAGISDDAPDIGFKFFVGYRF